MDDVLIVGAGPAGTVAGLVLARAGVRVRIVDRARFPRDKLCGDTINPGTLGRLRGLGIAHEVERRGLRVDGMVVTGERGEVVEGRYPEGLHGVALVRRDLDQILLDQAIAAGCRFDPGVMVTGAVADGRRVTGVTLAGRRCESRLTAPITVAADGRRSAIAFGLGVARHPDRPRRWAIGAYYEGVGPAPRASGGAVGGASLGEMHIRQRSYIGVAPVGAHLTNVCLVRPSRPADGGWRDPAALLRRTLAADPWLCDRFVHASLATLPVVLGPLAVDAPGPALDGLVLAGDAAGFIDPMTGDGLRFAVRGGELAAEAALDALMHGWVGVNARLARARARAFRRKERFNRALRAVVGSPAAIAVGAFVSRAAPWIMRAVIARAGDCL